MAEPFSQRLESLLLLSDTIECSLCYEPTAFVAVGTCGHAEVCWLCALRLRWLCRDTSCAICKEDLSSIAIRPPPDHDDPAGSNPCWSITSAVSFSSEIMYRESLRLRGYYCPFPCGDHEDFWFKTLSDLQTHLKRDHGGAMFCSLCLDYRQAFLPEQHIYSPNELAAHMKAEHPSCEFCPKETSRHYSIDELLGHMNQSHFKCNVCERLDYRNEYYVNFESLDRHFEESHFRCENQECREQRFVVFPEEEDLRLHMLEKHRSSGLGSRLSFPFGPSSSATGGGSKKKLRLITGNGQILSSSHNSIHFRGPKHAGRNVVTCTSQGTARAYPPDLVGKAYDKRVHAKINFRVVEKAKNKNDWINYLSSGSVVLPTDLSYQAENVAFFKRLSSLESPESIAKIKQVSRQFLEGKSTPKIFLTSFASSVSKLENLVPVLQDLIRLMPSQIRRTELLNHIIGATPKPCETEKQKKHLNKTSSIPPIPDNLFDVSSRKPCLINALVAILMSTQQEEAAALLPQSIISAMENKIAGCDRMQLTTLSEMRSHLLILAEGNLKNVSWKHADSVLSLRPLLYRLLQIPESHRSRQQQLILSGWRSFYQYAINVLDSQFSPIERLWLKAYITFAALRLSSIGDTVHSKRLDFPTLPSSAYFPSTTNESSSATPPPVPKKTDFPVGLVVSSQTRPPLIVGNHQWQSSSADNLTHDSFPQLDHIPAPSSSNRPWNCPRCTFLNTRLLSTACEICGMDRPPPSEEAATSSNSTAPTADRPRRTKQRIILSSSSQRDYTR